MALTQVTAGSRILITDLNQFYNILKGVSGSGESITLVHNGGSVILQPTSDPAASTDGLIVKNAAGTTLAAITYDGKVEAADGTAALPGLAFDDDTDTGIYRSAANTLDVAAGGVRALQISTTASAVNYLDVAPSAAGNALTATAEGTDANISINLVPKGSGVLQSAGAAVSTTGHSNTHHTDRTRREYIPAGACTPNGTASLSNLDAHTVFAWPDAAALVGASGGWMVPDDFVSLTNVYALIHSAVSADCYFAIRDSSAFASGQNYQNRADSIAAGVVALTANIVNRVDITAAVDGLTLAVGDTVGIRVNRESNNAADTLNTSITFFGFLITYTADM